MHVSSGRMHNALGTVLVTCLLFGAACQSKKVPELGSTSEGPSASPGAAGVAAQVGTSSSTPGIADAAPELDASKGNGLPEGSPRFAWGGPLSVRVEEKTQEQQDKIRFTYLLDVCPGSGGGTLVTHRDLHVTELEGQTTNGPEPNPIVKKVEAGVSMLPTMVIDRTGNFEHGTGYPELLKHLSASFPGEDFSYLRKLIVSGQAATILDASLAQLWEGWVGAWMHFDPSRGVSQELAVDSGGAAGANGPSLYFDCFTTDRNVKLHARLTPSRAELEQLVANTHGDPDSVRGAEKVWSVEIEWPVMRPWRAHSHRSATVTVDGKDTSLSEEHEYVFAWPAQGAKAPKCPSGG